MSYAASPDIARRSELALLVRRERARQNRSFVVSDMLRNDLGSRGWQVEDGHPNASPSESGVWLSARRYDEALCAGQARAFRESTLERRA